MIKRRPGTADPSTLPQMPIPPKLEVKLTKVFLGTKHLREMKASDFEYPKGIQWNWELWVDAKGKEYASVKHGRNIIWYKLDRPLITEAKGDTLDGSFLPGLDPFIE